MTYKRHIILWNVGLVQPLYNIILSQDDIGTWKYRERINSNDSQTLSLGLTHTNYVSKKVEENCTQISNNIAFYPSLDSIIWS